jgi:hypothetical protein
MKHTLFITLLLVTLLSVACSQLPAQQTVEPSPVEGQQPTDPGMGSTDEPEPYPGVQPTPDQVYPGPVDPGAEPPLFVPGEASAFEPQEDDMEKKRGEAYLQLENSELLVMESYPVQAVLTLRGDLPDPCHELRVIVLPPDDYNNVQVEVYTVRDPEAVCAAVLEPFEARINLGSFAGGVFKILVNGTELGTING